MDLKMGKNIGRIARGAAVVVAGLSAAQPCSAAVPAQISSVAAALKALGYEEVAFTTRIFGGYVLQGRKGDDFVIVALGEAAKEIALVEIYRDADDNGVFGADEQVSPAEAEALQAQVETLSATEAASEDEETVETPSQITIAGFTQQSEALFAGASLQSSAHEELGSDSLVTSETSTLTDVDITGEQSHKRETTQTTSFPALTIKDSFTSVIQPGGTTMSFAPLGFPGGLPDAEALRAGIISQTPDAETLGAVILGASGDADSLRAAILAGIPDAETIQSAIIPPN